MFCYPKYPICWFRVVSNTLALTSLLEPQPWDHHHLSTLHHLSYIQCFYTSLELEPVLVLIFATVLRFSLIVSSIVHKKVQSQIFIGQFYLLPEFSYPEFLMSLLPPLQNIHHWCRLRVIGL